MAKSIEELLQDVIERLDQISARQIAQAKMEPQPLLTTAELARELKQSVWGVYRLAQHGDIPCHRLGRTLRFDLERVLEATARKERQLDAAGDFWRASRGYRLARRRTA